MHGWRATLKSYPLRHDQGDKLLPIMQAYRDLLNSIITDIWNKIEWRKKQIDGKEQVRVMPHHELSRSLERS